MNPQPEHGEGVGIPNPSHRHQQTERLPEQVSDAPGPGEPVLEQRQPPTLHLAGQLPSLLYRHQFCTLAKLWAPNLFFYCHPVQMALKCADICNPCRPWELSKQWSEKVTEEFFQQGFLLFCCLLLLFLFQLIILHFQFVLITVPSCLLRLLIT